jgi:hypothetical protein
LTAGMIDYFVRLSRIAVDSRIGDLRSEELEGMRLGVALSESKMIGYLRIVASMPE